MSPGNDQSVAGFAPPYRLQSGPMTGVALYRGTAALLWALALWHCWMARGLYLDGSSALFGMMKNGGYALFYPHRATLMAVTQAPAAMAINLGVTDSHLLARLLSLGLFAVPVAFYHAALFRARHDLALLAMVLCAVAIVFLPSWFFIIGEYNSVHAAVLFVALVLASGTRPTIGDGLLLLVPAAMLIRSYETMSCFGPLLAAFTLWRLRSEAGWIARALYGLAAALFLVSAAFAAVALLDPSNPAPVSDALNRATSFWRNFQFIVPFAALSILVAAAVLAPRLLETPRLFWLAAIPLMLLATSPLLLLVDIGIGPAPRSHYHTRTMSGLVMAAIVVAVWFQAGRPSQLAKPVVRRLLVWQMAAVLAALPADLVLSVIWQDSIAVFQSIIASRSGPIPVEDTPLLRLPWAEMIEQWALPSESSVLRRAASDGIIVQPRDFTSWQPFDPLQPLPPGVAKFMWR
jgi:hypothetical protein